MKMNLLKFFLTILISLSLTNAEQFRFDNYKLIRLVPTTESHLSLINSLKDDNDFDVWNGLKGVNNSVYVLLPPFKYNKYKTIFQSVNLPFTIEVDNMQEKFDEQSASMIRFKSGTDIVGKYARYSEIISFINELTANNSDIVSSYSAGSTYERRDLRVVVLKTPTSQRNVWIDCGIHAREWIATSTCIWFIDTLIKEYRNNDPIAVDLLNYYEFHILPLVNPDGYEYSHNTYRLWRKNRKPNTFSSCVGTDLNRNYNYQWMVSGSSSSPCSDSYAGASPSSELETIAVQNAISSRSGKFDVFFTLHSYGGYWMPPWAYSSVPASDYAELEALSKIGVEALKNTNGLVFKIGPPYITVGYSASGGSYDWAKARQNVKYAFALELRPLENTPDYFYGFALPEDRVPLAGKETYAGLKATISAIRNKKTSNQ